MRAGSEPAGGMLVSILTEPAHDKARAFGVRATRYAVEADGAELAEIERLVAAGKVKPHIQCTFPLEAAADAMWNRAIRSAKSC